MYDDDLKPEFVEKLNKLLPSFKMDTPDMSTLRILAKGLRALFAQYYFEQYYGDTVDELDMAIKNKDVDKVNVVIQVIETVFT